MTIKHPFSRLLAGALILGATPFARAVLPLGEGAEAFVTLKAGVEYNDNFFLSSANETSETIWSVTPGLQILFGQNSLAQSKFTYTENFKFYNDNSNLDAAKSEVYYATRYNDDKLAVDVDASFQQLDQPTRDARGGGLVKRTVLNAGIDGEVNLTEKTSVRLGIEYNDTNYKRATFSDWEWLRIPLAYYYEVAPKLDASFGYAYKDNTLATKLDSTEHFYNVGARGELAPKLTGEVRVGFRQTKPEVGATRETLGIDSNFTYNYSPKTSIDAGISNDFGFSGTGESYRNLGLNLGLTSDISAEFQAGIRLYYNRYSYNTTVQEDDFFNGSLSATYKFSEFAALTGSYAYVDNSSNSGGASFTGNTFSLAVSLRY